jgi:hypothetical protein
VNAHTQSHAAYYISPPPTTRLPPPPNFPIASRFVITIQIAMELNIRSQRDYVLCFQTCRILCLPIRIMLLRSGMVADVKESVPEFID